MHDEWRIPQIYYRKIGCFSTNIIIKSPQVLLITTITDYVTKLTFFRYSDLLPSQTIHSLFTC